AATARLVADALNVMQRMDDVIGEGRARQSPRHLSGGGGRRDQKQEREAQVRGHWARPGEIAVAAWRWNIQSKPVRIGLGGPECLVTAKIATGYAATVAMATALWSCATPCTRSPRLRCWYAMAPSMGVNTMPGP